MRAESSRLTSQATELVQAGKKDRALLVLKMRRLREEESQKAEGQLLNVEKLVGVNLFWWCRGGGGHFEELIDAGLIDLNCPIDPVITTDITDRVGDGAAQGV